MSTAQPEPICCRLADRDLIRIGGADARTFLQGQLSSDVRLLSPERSQLATLNTPQGRTLALLRLVERDDAIYLSLPASLTSATIERLRRYVLRARIEIEHARDDVASFGIAGGGAETALATAGFSLPAAVDDACAHAGVVAVRVRAHAGCRYELFGDPQQLTTVMNACRPADAAEWRLLDTLAGIPLLSPATSGEFVPQMLNLDRLDALNFKKGCYTGQEVIARAHYRGQVKRRLRLAFASGEVAPGTAVRAAAGDGTGSVVQSALDPDGGAALLIVAPVDWRDGDTIRFDEPGEMEARLATAAEADTA